MKRIVRTVLFAALLSLLLIPAVVPAAAGGGPTNKPTTTVSIKSASLAPGGVAVAFVYSCFPSGPYGGFGDVRVAQTNGASGDSFFNPICNDSNVSQTVEVFGPFIRGDAAVQVFVCGFDCNQATKEVKVS